LWFPSPNFYTAASEEQMLKWLEPQLMHKFCFLMAEPAIKKVKLATADGNGTGTQKADNRASISNAQGAVQPTEADSWPHKHRPQSTNDIIGNQSIVKQVRDWLLQWDANHGSVEKGKKSRGNTSSAIKKAVLLSGPPGIGKTTTARLLCQELGLEALEVL
jgi:replication factor C subunit 1